MEVMLKDGTKVQVDEEDMPRLRHGRGWHADRDGMICIKWTEGGKTRHAQLHRLILNPPKGMEIDHINRDVTDNRKRNLRICTRAENARNRGPNRGNKHGHPYKGLVFLRNRRVRKWAAVVFISGRRIYLGCFKTPEEAAHAYDRGAKQHHGEFAWLNFPKDPVAQGRA